MWHLSWRRDAAADQSKKGKSDRLALAQAAEAALFPNGPPVNERDREQFFELYKLMVASSEALVNRRQGVNTFFLTINGVLVTAIGLFLRNGGGDEVRLQAGGILVLALAGILLCYAWRSLLNSFGQLNTGKFVIINRMEKALPAAIYDAEWEALGRGDDPSVYRSFTTRETVVPVAVGFLYLLTAILSALVAVRWWHLGG